MLLQALLALPALQEFRCRRSRVGHLQPLMQFACLVFDTELAVMLPPACMHTELGAHVCEISTRS